MTASTSEDLDALFEEVAAQHSGAGGTASAVIAAAHTEEPVSVATAMETSTSVMVKPQYDPSAERPAMFDSLGHIVRQLHDSLRELGYDRSLAEISGEVTDAASRLEYIGTLTEQAANKFLNSIDEAMPVQDALIKNACGIEARWNDLFSGKMSVEEFKMLAQESPCVGQFGREDGRGRKSPAHANHDGAGLSGHYGPDYQEDNRDHAEHGT